MLFGIGRLNERKPGGQPMMVAVYLYSNMRFKVYVLRRRGRRLPRREWINGPTYIGDLRSQTVEHDGVRYNVATLLPVDAPIKPSPIPELYEPVLLGFSLLAFRLRGYESLQSTAGHIGVVQEWHCELP